MIDMAAGKYIAVWSGPRNISTALLRSWENRSDTFVSDEPLYAHYLAVTRKIHPGRDETLARHDADWQRVVAWLTGPIPGDKKVFYQKHMAHHLIPGVQRDWIPQLENVLLIRNPRDMLASLVKHIPDPEMEETGLPQQLQLYDGLRSLGKAPVVLDAYDVLENPESMLRALCDAVGVAFAPEMLSWPEGPRDTDGAWAPYWYREVWKTTQFSQRGSSHTPLASRYQGLREACDALYDQLHAARLTG